MKGTIRLNWRQAAILPAILQAEIDKVRPNIPVAPTFCNQFIKDLEDLIQQIESQKFNDD